jgi:two-component system, response regulator YesN
MIKVLIIDDEPFIREGLRKTINWKALQCRVIGEAENGVEAIEKIDMYVPDIVITDIMMPGHSGLELTRYIKDNHPHIKIIFLTGYNDFSFAQQAIKLGAFDFVLKPTNTDELEKVIIKARDEIIKSNSEMVEHEKLHKVIEASLPILKDKFISDLLYSNSVSVNEIEEKLQFFGINIESFIVMCIEIDNFLELNKRNTEEEKLLQLFSVEEKIEELLNRCRIKGIINCNQNTFSVIMQFSRSESEEILKAGVISIAEELRNKFENCSKFTISIGISHYFDKVYNIKKAFDEAMKCLENRFYIGNNSTIHIDDIFSFEAQSVSNEIQTKPIIEAIRAGNTEKIKSELKDIITTLSQINNKVYVTNICTEIIASISRLYCELYGNMSDIFEEGTIPFDRILGCTSLADLFSILENLSDKVCQSINNLLNTQTRKVISNALDYINRHFHEDITLNVVSEQVYMSPWYFSKLFKKETGETFTEFLLKCRIEKAKKLLKGSFELKAYEVAEQVGFNDARYFGQIFKKETGLTPMEYRDSV